MVDMELESELIFLENRIRDLISSLVSPLITKIEDHDKVLEKLQKHDVKHKIRNKDLEDKMQRSLIRLVPLEDFNKKMFDVFSETRSLEHITTRRLEQFNSSINQLTHHFEYLKVSYRTMEEVQSNNEKMFKTSEKSIRETKDSVKKQMAVIENLLQKHLYETSHVLETLNGKVDTLCYKFNELNEKTIPSLQFFMKRVKENNDILTQKVEGLSKERVTFKDIKEFKLRMETDNSNMRNRLNHDLKTMNSFFDKALKFTISSEIYEVLIETAEIDHLTVMGPAIRSDLKQTCTLIDESKDMKSENYQLPTATVSQLIHLKHVYEKQLKIIEERKKSSELRRISDEQFSGTLNVDYSKNPDEFSGRKSPSREFSYINSPTLKGFESLDSRLVKIEESFKERVKTEQSPKGKSEALRFNEMNVESSPKASLLASTVKTETGAKPVSLSIGGQTQINIERSIKNNIQTVFDIRITPHSPIRSQFSKESLDSLESRPYSGASNLRESFLMVPPQIYQKSASPLPLLPIKEKPKDKKKTEKDFNIDPFIESSESESLENSEKTLESHKIKEKSEIQEIKTQDIRKSKIFEAKNREFEAKDEEIGTKNEEIGTKNEEIGTKDEEKGEKIRKSSKREKIAESKTESYEKLKQDSFVENVKKAEKEEETLHDEIQADSKLSLTNEKIEMKSKAEKRKSRSKPTEKAKPLKKLLEKTQSSRKQTEKKPVKKSSESPEKVAKSQELHFKPDRKDSNQLPNKNPSTPDLPEPSSLNRDQPKSPTIKSDESSKNLPGEKQQKLDPSTFPIISQAEIESQKLELSKIQEDFKKVAEKNSKKLKKTQEKLIKFSTDFIQKEIKKLKIAKKKALEKIEESAETVRNMMINDQEELRINIRLIYDENKYLMKQRNTDMIKVDNDLKQVTSVQTEQMSDLQYIKEALSSLKNFQDCLLETSHIMFNLIKQDEKDREGLQLTGYSESKSQTKYKQPLTLRPECLSCSGQASSVYSAFKLACINYLPSEVEYKQKKLPRKSLIRVLGEYLSHIQDYPYFSPTLHDSKTSGIREEHFLKSTSKTPKLSSRYLLNATGSKIVDLESSFLKRS